MRSLNAFYALRPWGQTNAPGEVLPRQPSRRRGKKQLLLVVLTLRLHPVGEGQQTGWRANETTPGLLRGGKIFPSHLLFSERRPGGPQVRPSRKVPHCWGGRNY